MYQALRSLSVLPDDEQAYLRHHKNETEKRLMARRERDREERQQEISGTGNRDRPLTLPARPIALTRKISKQGPGSSSSPSILSNVNFLSSSGSSPLSLSPHSTSSSSSSTSSYSPSFHFPFPSACTALNDTNAIFLDTVVRNVKELSSSALSGNQIKVQNGIQ